MKRFWPEISGILFGAAVLAFVFWFLTPPDVPPGAQGWVDDKKAVADVVAGLPRPVFANAAPELIKEADVTKDALLYLFVKRVNGGTHPKAHQQNPVGSCVSHGWSSGVEYLQCVDIVLKNRALTYKPISHSFIYGTSRVDIGGGRIGGDGSVGAWAAKAVNTIGVISCEDAGDNNYTSTFTREWGSRGPPAAMKEKAAKTKVKTVSLVTSAHDVMAALQNGYPVPVCFNVGFAMQRDSDGFCRTQGSWAHCQLCAAYRADKKQFLLIQSWGDNVPSGPTVKDQPDYSFWIGWDVVDRMCRGGDCFAISNFDGFPGRPRVLDWFVSRDVERPVLARARSPRFWFAPDGGYLDAFSRN